MDAGRELDKLIADSSKSGDDIMDATVKLKQALEEDE